MLKVNVVFQINVYVVQLGSINIQCGWMLGDMNVLDIIEVIKVINRNSLIVSKRKIGKRKQKNIKKIRFKYDIYFFGFNEVNNQLIIIC